MKTLRHILPAFAVLALTSCTSAPEVLPPIERLDYTGYTVGFLNTQYTTVDSYQRAYEVIEFLSTLDLTIVGLQEVVTINEDDLIHDQNFMMEAILNSHWGSVSSHGYSRTGSINPILYDRSRAALIESGTQWFSSTPFVPDSITYGNTRPRQFTWALFCDRNTDELFAVINTHLDHENEESRGRSVAQLVDFISQKGFDRLILGGDFNSLPGSKPLLALSAFLDEIPFDTPTFVPIPVQIDHVFYTGFEIGTFEAIDTGLSDHRLLRFETYFR